MSEVHNLTITNGGKAECSCGEKMPDGNTSVQSVKEWEKHKQIRVLTKEVAKVVRIELEARAQAEDFIRTLLTLGVSSREISRNIGNDAINGKALISPTTIERLGREEHQQSPRRRRR